MITEYDIEQLYQATFGSKPYKVPALTNSPEEKPFQISGTKTNLTQITGSTLSTQFNGVEIWLPVWFRNLPNGIGDNGTLFMPYTVVKISGKKTIVKTPMAERRGTVKEQYNIDDYDITVKGFLIDQQRVWPEQQIKELRQLFETPQAVSLDNALINIFLDQGDKVVIGNFDCPEVEGGRKHVRPFTMSIESDSIFTLELEE